MSPYSRVGTENRTSLDNPVILAVESFKVTSYKFRFSDEMMFILPSNDFLLEFFGHVYLGFYRQTNNRCISKLRLPCYLSPEATIYIIEASIKHPCPFLSKTTKNCTKLNRLCLQLRQPEVLCCDYSSVTRTRDSIQSRD